MKRRSFAATVGAAIGALALAGCAAFWNSLPTVISVISTAGNVIAEIQAWVDSYFAAKPDPATQKRVDDALQRTRAALVAVDNALAGAKDVHDANLQAAIAAFEAAYQALLDIVAPLSVRPVSGKRGFTVNGDVLEVPATSDIMRGLK